MSKNENVQNEQEIVLSKISLDKNKVKKVAKSLFQNLEKETESGKKLSLSLVQESLASSLGFRNWNSLDKRLKEQSLEDVSKKAKNQIKKVEATELSKWINKYSEEELVELFTINLDLNEMWSSRTIDLIHAGIKIIKELAVKHPHFLERKEDIFMLLTNESLINISKNKALEVKGVDSGIYLSKEVVHFVKSFLYSIAGFNHLKDKQTETFDEQLGYLYMVSINSLNIVDTIREFGDVCLWKNSWTSDKKYFDRRWSKEEQKDIYEIYLMLNSLMGGNKEELYIRDLERMYVSLGIKGNKILKTPMCKVSHFLIRCHQY